MYWILGEETGMYQVMDNNIIVKLAEPNELLEDIELKTVEREILLGKLKVKSHSSELQILDKNKFKEKIILSLQK